MSGRLLFDGPPAGPHEHLTFHFDDASCLRFVDPRRFGMLDLTPDGGAAGASAARRPRPRAARRRLRRAGARGRAGRPPERAQARADGSAGGGRGGQHLRLRRACSGRGCRRGGPPATCGRARPCGWREAVRTVLAGGDRGRRLVAARLCPDRWPARLLPGALCRLRAERPALPRLRAPIRRIAQANRATFFCPALPALSARLRGQPERCGGQFRTGRARGRSCYSRTLAASRDRPAAPCHALRRQRRWKILSGAKSHGVRDHPGRGARAGRLDHPQSAEGPQRAESPADRGAQSGAQRVRGRSRDRGHGADRLRAGVRSRRGRQGNGDHGFHGGVAGRLHRPLAARSPAAASRSSRRWPDTRWAAAASLP